MTIDDIAKLLDERLKPIEENILRLEQKVTGDIQRLEQKEDKRYRFLRKTANMIIGHFDKEDIELDKRIERIERHLGLSRFQN